jgi:hypothetical protein
MYEGTSAVTFGGCSSSNTGDTHNEPSRASAWPIPDNLYVVVGYGPRHNSPVEWAAQGPLPRLHLPIQHKIRRNVQLPVLLVEQLAKQRRERLLELLVEQLLEPLATQLREQPRIQVKVELKIQVQIHVFVQVATQVKTPLPVLPGELLRILLGVQRTTRRANQFCESSSESSSRHSLERSFTRSFLTKFRFPIGECGSADGGLLFSPSLSIIERAQEKPQAAGHKLRAVRLVPGPSSFVPRPRFSPRRCAACQSSGRAHAPGDAR